MAVVLTQTRNRGERTLVPVRSAPVQLRCVVLWISTVGRVSEVKRSDSA